MTALTAELAFPLRADLAESPVWDARRQRLFCVDLLARKIHALASNGGDVATIEAPSAVGCIAPRTNGQLIAAVAEGIAAVDFDTGLISTLHTPTGHDPRQCRFNDGKCDPQGRFWAGTLSWQGTPGAGALYCFHDARTSERVVPEVSVSNGLAWTRDGNTVYYIDSRTRRVDAFDFHGATARLSRRRAAVVFPPGDDLPDGCVIDDEDMLWVAHWRGGRVSRWDPRSGRILAVVQVPAPRVTSCAFGGADRGTLFITTARRGMSDAELAAHPEAGGIFSCRPGITGPVAVAFGG